MTIKEINKDTFNKADSKRTRRGNIQIDNNTVYGFYLNDFFFYTKSNHYYRVEA